MKHREYRDVALTLGVLALFVVVRIALLVARDPFFDELFTVWLVKKPLGAMFEALRHDSGPPLYYLLLKLCGARSVLAARVVSLVCATLAATLIATARPLGRTRFVAVLLLAVEPTSVLFSIDARSYALCALGIAAGLVALAHGRDVLAALAFTGAAYSHYYGVFFFATLPRWRAFAIAALLYVPGLLLARGQPAEAMAWLGRPPSMLHGLPFAGEYPGALFLPAMRPLVFGVAIVLLFAVARVWRPSRFVLIPAALALATALTARPVYFPMRFESVLAIPLVLWIAASLAKWPRPIAIALAGALLAAGTFVSLRGIREHADRPLDDFRVAAQMVARMDTRVVASGYLYLETVAARGDRVEAFPPEQAVHPGWRATLPAEPLRTAAQAMPRTPFVWIGENGAPELGALCGTFGCRVLARGPRALIVSMR